MVLTLLRMLLSLSIFHHTRHAGERGSNPLSVRQTDHDLRVRTAAMDVPKVL